MTETEPQAGIAWGFSARRDAAAVAWAEWATASARRGAMTVDFEAGFHMGAGRVETDVAYTFVMKVDAELAADLTGSEAT